MTKNLLTMLCASMMSIPLVSCSPSPDNSKIMLLTSPAFQNEGFIPAQYTCDDSDISPPLEWSEVPEGTLSFVLIVDDPDAVPVAGFVWDHWILYNIAPNIRSIAENSTVGTKGITSFKRTGYGGPCPPNGEHTYFFKLYAVDINLKFDTTPKKEILEEAIKGHVLAKAELKGRYNRNR